MKNYFLIIFLELLIFTEELELRKLLSKKKKTIVIIGCSLIGFLLCLLVVLLIIHYFIKKNIIQRRTTQTNPNRKKLTNEEKNLIFKKKEYLFQNELKPKILKLKNPENYFDKCPICLDKIKENDIITYTPCNHIFHFDCFKQYMFITTDTHCPLCKFDFFSLLNEKDIDFNIINVENNNNIKTEEHFINNPSHRSDANNKSIKIRKSIRKLLFSSPTVIGNIKDNRENDSEITAKLKLNNQQNSKMIFFSDYKKRNIYNDRIGNSNIEDTF